MEILFINRNPNEQAAMRMGEIRGVVSKDAEDKFRLLAMKKFGYGKGSLSKALEEALNNWVMNQEAPSQNKSQTF